MVGDHSIRTAETKKSVVGNHNKGEALDVGSMSE